MKNPEQAIDKLLSDLRDASAPPGMEGRILDALHNRASAPPLSAWRRLMPLWLTAHAHRVAVLSAACGVAGVLAFSLNFPAVHRAGLTSAPSKSSPVYLQPLPSTATMETSHPTSLTTSTSISRPTKKSHARRAPITDANDALAERELHAASLPEPPMPLTEQEKLLLRIVHSSDPVELAQLDSTAWTARNAEEKANFDRFFEPKKPEATGDNQ